MNSFLEKKIINHFEYIYFASNILIKSHTSLINEYEQIAIKLCNQINNDPRENKIMVICGNMFASTDINDISINLCKNLLLNLVSLLPVVVVLGPNDNIILSILDSLPKVVVLKQGFEGEFLYGNINFVSLNAKHVINRRDQGIINICIDYLDYNHYCANKNIVHNKEDCELILLGGHKYYKQLDDSNSVVYSGNLIQQEFHDKYENHGFMVFPLGNDEPSAFINIRNDYAHIKLTYKNGGINVNKYEWLSVDGDKMLPRTPNILVKYSGSKDECQKCIKAIFPNVNSIFYINCEENIKKNVKVFVDRRLAVLNYIAGSDYKEPAIKYFDNLLLNIPYAKEMNVNLEIIDLYFGNMFGYGNKNFINLKQRGIIGIDGLNASGKSSIFNIILYLLFGKYSEDGRGHQNVIGANQKFFIGVINFIVNKVKYRVIKYCPKGSTLYTRVYTIDENGKKTLVTLTNKMTYDAYLTNLMGPFEVLYKTCMVNHKDINFLDLNENNRICLLSKLYGVNMFDEMYEVIKSDISNTRKTRKNLKLNNTAEYCNDAKNIIEKLNLKKQDIDNKFIGTFTPTSNEAKNSKIMADYIEAHIKINESLKKAQNCVTDFEKLKNDIKIADYNCAVQELLLKTLAKRGIVLKLLEPVLITIQNCANEFLSCITTMRMKFVEGTTQIEISDESNNLNKVRSNCGSGFQLFILSLAIRYAFLQTSLFQTNFIFIDEGGFGNFDRENIVKLTNVFNVLREKFRTIIIISHIDSVKQKYDHQIDIIKKDYSYIKNNSTKDNKNDVIAHFLIKEIEGLNIPASKKDIGIYDYKPKLFIKTDY
jgi:hypothetical protein